jgi:hypothetical protein
METTENTIKWVPLQPQIGGIWVGVYIFFVYLSPKWYNPFILINGEDSYKRNFIYQGQIG